MTSKGLQLSLDRLLKLGTVLTTFGILTVVSIQAFARLCLPSAPAWTEEAARFFFLFLVAFAAPMALRDKSFVRVDTLALHLPARLNRWLSTAINLIVMSLMLAVTTASVGFVRLGLGQLSPCLRLPMALIHGALFLLASVTALYAGAAVYRDIRSGVSGEPQS